MVSISNSGGYPISWSAELQVDDNGLDLSVEEGGFSIIPNSGTLLINKLEVNNEDNCVMCKIDIIKRSN